MSPASALGKEEKLILCDLITGKEFKEYFKKKPEEFYSMQIDPLPLESLSDQDALSLAKSHLKHSFINAFIEKKVDQWLKSITSHSKNLQREGLNYSQALSTAILDSPFGNHLGLYLKLTGKNWNARLNLIKEMENRKLDAEHNNSLISSNNPLEKRRPDNKKGSHDYLKEFDDRDNSLLPSKNDNFIFSLCGIDPHAHERNMVIRRADLEPNGHYHVFQQDKDKAPFFQNRDRIYCKPHSFDDYFHGTWAWSVESNDKDPSKDFVKSNYIKALTPIEVIIIPGLSSLDHLVSFIKEGAPYQLHSNKVMFSFQTSKKTYTGILCQSKDLKITQGRAHFHEDCIEVPVYQFQETDILNLSHISFYKNVFAGIPSQIYPLKTTFEVVKGLVFSSLSWSFCKEKGLARSEYNQLKHFISELPADNLLSKIQSQCHCSQAEAENLLKDFLSKVGECIDKNTFQDEVILSAIATNKEFEERTKTLIRTDWEHENKTLINTKQNELNSLNAQLTSLTSDLNKAHDALEKSKQEKTRLTNTIAQKEKLATEVETMVAKKIQAAKENAADFIATMAFVDGQQTKASSSTFSVDQYQVISKSYNLEYLEAHQSWLDVIDTTSLELSEAGVADSYSYALATFLCAAYIKKQPLLLVGPNANDIIEAFCASISCWEYGVLSCQGLYTNELIKKINLENKPILVIKNMIGSDWMNHLPEILSNKDTFYIATHPYPEDVQVEPKSLYGFMLPLFTEFFVESDPSHAYRGGYFTEDFEEYAFENKLPPHLKSLSKLQLSPLVQRKIEDLVAIMHDIYPSIEKKTEFLFVLLPVASGLLRIDKLQDKILEIQKNISSSSNLDSLLNSLLGEYYE